MHRVNLYIYSTIRGSREIDGIVGYMLEAPLLDPTGSHNKTEMLPVTMTRLKSVLYGIKCGLERITKPAKVHIFVDETRFKQAFMGNMLQKWQENGWITTKGTEVKYKEEWESILRILSEYRHLLEITCDKEFRSDPEKDGYYEWMRREAERRLSDGRTKGT